MNAKLCDACKKVISEKEIKRGSLDYRFVELCEDCKAKFDEIENKYNIKFQELDKQHKDLRENFKNELEQIGIDCE